MHKYLIELMKYTEAGVPTNEYTYDSADTPQGAMDKFSKWNKMHYTTTDPESGETTVGSKMYEVTLKQGVYQPIADVDAFVQMNAVEYHA